MKITFMTLQKASIVCLGVGMFLALGSAGTFETTGEIQTGVYVAAFVFLLAAGLLMPTLQPRTKRPSWPRAAQSSQRRPKRQSRNGPAAFP